MNVPMKGGPAPTVAVVPVPESEMDALLLGRTAVRTFDQYVRNDPLLLNTTSLPEETLKDKIQNMSIHIRRKGTIMKNVQGKVPIKPVSPISSLVDIDKNKKDANGQPTRKQINKSTTKKASTLKKKFETKEEMMKFALDVIAANSKDKAGAIDENQMFGNFIASKFRHYSQHTKNELQHKIGKILFQADQGYFDQQVLRQPGVKRLKHTLQKSKNLPNSTLKGNGRGFSSQSLKKLTSDDDDISSSDTLDSLYF